MIPNKRKHVAGHIVLGTLFIVSIIPVVFVAVKSMTVSESGGVSFDEFINVMLLSEKFRTAFVNSLIYTLFITLGQTIFGIWMALLFSRFKFKFRSPLLCICLALMVLPNQTMIVQTYRIVKGLSLTDQYSGVIIPQIFLPVGILFLRQYFVRIPDAITDAARIDGATTLQILRKILLPMSKNGVCMLIFLSFIDSYNMYELPLIIIRDDRKLPLSLVIRNAIENYPGQIYVPAILYLIPPVLIFLMLKDNIVNGMMYNE